MTVHGAPPSARVTLHPVVDLDTGTVVAATTSGGAADDAESDVDRAILTARGVAERGSSLPVQLTLPMRTVADERALGRLHRALDDLGRRPRGTIVSVTGVQEAMSLTDAAARLSGLRSAGYLLGLEAAENLPPRFVADVNASLLALAPEVARRTTADPRCSAVADALVALARRVGGRVLAPGVISDDQLAHLRGLGIRLAQGPLLAPPGWRPGEHVPVPVAAHSDPSLGPRVTQFLVPAAVMAETATAAEVLTAFSDPSTTSVVLVDQRQRPRHAVDRTRFLLQLSGAYGHALYARKPAARLAAPPRLVPRTVPVIAALRAAGGSKERVYDDLVVIDEVGRCLGVVRVADLIRSLPD